MDYLIQVYELLPLNCHDKLVLRSVCKFFSDNYTLVELICERFTELDIKFKRQDFNRRTIISTSTQKVKFKYGELVFKEIEIPVVEYFNSWIRRAGEVGNGKDGGDKEDGKVGETDERTIRDFKSEYGDVTYRIKKRYHEGNLIYSEEVDFEKSYDYDYFWYRDKYVSEAYPIYHPYIKIFEHAKEHWSRDKKYMENFSECT